MGYVRKKKKGRKLLLSFRENRFLDFYCLHMKDLDKVDET